jgi:hypothetical protein
MKQAIKRWECQDCDYTTTHPKLAENHRNGHNHKCEIIWEQPKLGQGWELEEDE